MIELRQVLWVMFDIVITVTNLGISGDAVSPGNCGDTDSSGPLTPINKDHLAKWSQHAQTVRDRLLPVAFVGLGVDA